MSAGSDVIDDVVDVEVDMDELDEVEDVERMGGGARENDLDARGWVGG